VREKKKNFRPVGGGEERRRERDLGLRVMRSEFISVTSLSCQTGDNVQKYSYGGETELV